MKDIHIFVLWHYILLDEYFHEFVQQQNLKVYQRKIRVYRKALGHEVPGSLLISRVGGREFEYEDLSISVHQENDVYNQSSRTLFRCNAEGMIFVLHANVSPGKNERHVELFGKTVKRFLKAYEKYDG